MRSDFCKKSLRTICRPQRRGASVLTVFERADPILIKIEAQRSGFNFGRKGSRTQKTGLKPLVSVLKGEARERREACFLIER